MSELIATLDIISKTLIVIAVILFCMLVFKNMGGKG